MVFEVLRINFLNPILQIDLNCSHKQTAILVMGSISVVADLKVVLKLITLGVKFQECAAHSKKSNNSKLTLERNLLIVLTAKR